MLRPLHRFAASQHAIASPSSLPCARPTTRILLARNYSRIPISKSYTSTTASRALGPRTESLRQDQRGLWTVNKDWRADQQPKTTLSEKPTGLNMSPNFEYKYLAKPATVAIVGCPFSGGQGRDGVDLAPNRLISAGLVSQLAGLGWEVHYETQQSFVDIPYNPVPANSTLAKDKAVNGDANPTPAESVRPSVVQRLPDPDIGNMKKPRLVSAVCEKVSTEVGRISQKGWLPLTLGGDHSLGMGTVSGTKSKYPDAALIWVDAHADINTPLTTGSGNLHGCPVSFLLGLTGCDVEPFNKWIKPCLKPEELVYVGLRDIDAGERKILKENGIKVFTMHDIDKHGIGKVMQMALDYVNANGERPIHLSFDVDALDPSEAPSTGTPVRGGLTFREGHYITEAVAETGLLVGLDIMEVNPSLIDSASADKTVAVGCSLARAALGETLL